MKTDVWMPFYVGDYLADTMDLSTEQHGAYVLLLFAYWKNHGPLPDDEEQFCRITGLMLVAWRKHRSRIARFFQIENGHWRHKRVDLELVRSDAVHKTNVSRAQKAAYARWGPKCEVKNQADKGDEAPMLGALLEQCPPQPQVHSTDYTHDTRAREGNSGDEAGKPRGTNSSDEAGAAPRLPTIEEVLAFTRTGREIPDEYARHYVDRCCVLKRWLRNTHRGLELIDWKKEIVVWWAKDQATWKAYGTSKSSGGNRINRSAGTANEGRGRAYDAAARTAVARTVSNARGPATGNDEASS